VEREARKKAWGLGLGGVVKKGVGQWGKTSLRGKKQGAWLRLAIKVSGVNGGAA